MNTTPLPSYRFGMHQGRPAFTPETVEDLRREDEFRDVLERVEAPLQKVQRLETALRDLDSQAADQDPRPGEVAVVAQSFEGQQMQGLAQPRSFAASLDGQRVAGWATSSGEVYQWQYPGAPCAEAVSDEGAHDLTVRLRHDHPPQNGVAWPELNGITFRLAVHDGQAFEPAHSLNDLGHPQHAAEVKLVNSLLGRSDSIFGELAALDGSSDDRNPLPEQVAVRNHNFSEGQFDAVSGRFTSEAENGQEAFHRYGDNLAWSDGQRQVSIEDRGDFLNVTIGQKKPEQHGWLDWLRGR